MKKKILIFIYLFLIMIPYKMKAQNNDYRKMIEYAVKAPSGHNTQPWKFKIGNDQIEILPDLSKELPIVDANHRELFISLGCAAENLCIAASAFNYTSEVNINNDGIITIKLKKSNMVTSNVLFNEIEKRQTNRNIYENRMIPDDSLSLYISAIEPEKNIHIYSWKKDSPIFDTLKQAVMKGNILQMDDSNFKIELKSWMRFNKKHSEATKDGLSYAVFGAPNLPSFISKPAMSSYLNSKKQNKGDMRKIESSSHFILFTTKNNSKNEWIQLGMYLERFLLKTTQSGIANAHMNQPCEIEELKAVLKEILPINGEEPQLLLRIGYGKPAPYSKRKSIDNIIIE